MAASNVYCKACASPLVQASDWAQQDADTWQVRIWCPECGFERQAVLGRPDVARLSYALENGFAYVLEALGELQDEIETGSAALDIVVRLHSERIAR